MKNELTKKLHYDDLKQNCSHLWFFLFCFFYPGWAEAFVFTWTVLVWKLLVLVIFSSANVILAKKQKPLFAVFRLWLWTATTWGEPEPGRWRFFSSAKTFEWLLWASTTPLTLIIFQKKQRHLLCRGKLLPAQQSNALETQRNTSVLTAIKPK